MRLIFPNFNNFFEFNEAKINRCVIENPVEWRKTIQALQAQIDYGVEFCKVFNDMTPLNPSKFLEVIYSPIGFNINQNRLLSKIYKSLSKNAYENENIIDTTKLKKQISNYIQKVLIDNDANLIFEREFDLANLFKITGVRFANTSCGILEKLLDYMLAVQEFEGDKIFIFIGLSDYLEEKERKAFYETVLSKGLKIFLIDRHFHNRNDNENVVIIDKDLCEI